MTRRVAILISGSGTNMVALARAMTADFPARPVLVLSNRPDAGGLARAADLGIPTAIIDHRTCGLDRAAFEDQLGTALAAAAPDIICLAGFMRVLTSGFVTSWQGRMLNIHPSLLPKYRGLHTHARALEAGDTEHGCTVHEVTPEMDGGPILGQTRLAIVPGDTPETLAARLLPLEHQLYPQALRRFIIAQRAAVDLT